LCAFLQDVDSIYDIVWARDPETGREVKYGDVRLAEEQQFSVYNFELADVEKTWEHFDLCEKECNALIEHYGRLRKDLELSRRISSALGTGDDCIREKSRFPLLAAYDLCLKCSHYFNILDARGAISVTERVGVIARVRALAVGIAREWMDQQYPSSEKKSDNASETPKPAAKEKNGKLAEVLT
jgi:glycyl-tRNA synthetase alpha chain